MPSPMENGQGELVSEDPDPDAIMRVSRETTGPAVHLLTYALEIDEAQVESRPAVGIYDPVKDIRLAAAWIATGKNGEYIEAEFGSESCKEPAYTRQQMVSGLISGAAMLTEAEVSSAVIRTAWLDSSKAFVTGAEKVLGDRVAFTAAEFGENIDPTVSLGNVRHIGELTARRELETVAA